MQRGRRSGAVEMAAVRAFAGLVAVGCVVALTLLAACGDGLSPKQYTLRACDRLAAQRAILDAEEQSRTGNGLGTREQNSVMKSDFEAAVADMGRGVSAARALAGPLRSAFTSGTEAAYLSAVAQVQAVCTDLR